MSLCRRGVEGTPGTLAGAATAACAPSSETGRMDTDLKYALEYVSDGIVALDAEWKIEYVNRRAELLIGRPHAELLGRDWWEVVDYLLRTPAEEEFRWAAAGHISRLFRVFHPPRYAWHQVQAIPSHGGLLLVMEDITDIARARQQEAVQDAVREVVDHAPVAITVLRGPDHRIEIMAAAIWKGAACGSPSRS